MQGRNEYLAFRRKFEPENIRLVIVAESPPASGKYFYNPAGAVSEPLFAAFMLQLGFTPTTKEMGLREFQRRGWILVDATYEPVTHKAAWPAMRLSSEIIRCCGTILESCCPIARRHWSW